MKSLILILQKFFHKKLPNPMGRWNTDNCNIKINKKIDFSNEDHCGPCGNYELYKKEFKKNHKK